MTSHLEKVENKLLSFNPIKSNSHAIDDFKHIIDSISDEDKKLLGEKFNTWKIACLYYFLTSSEYKTDLLQIAPQLIQKFKEVEAHIIHMNGKTTVNQELLKMLYAGTRCQKYLEFLDEKSVSIEV